MILGHPEDYVLFGTDSPWTDQAGPFPCWKSCSSAKEAPADSGGNALRLLGLA